MKKVRLTTENELILDDVKLSDQLGFVDNHGDKGHFVYVGGDRKGKDVICAVSTREYKGVPNASYGNLVSKENKKSLNGEVSLRGSACSIKALYKFETRKELYRWLSE